MISAQENQLALNTVFETIDNSEIYSIENYLAGNYISIDTNLSNEITDKVSSDILNTLLAGESQIAVDGYNGAQGNITLDLSSPDNDDFINRPTFNDPSFSVTGDNIGATRELGEPSHAGNYGGSSVVRFVLSKWIFPGTRGKV